MKKIVIVLILFLPRLLFAQQTEPSDRVVMQVSVNEMVVDLGSDHGAQVGTKLNVYRKLTIVHPVTKKEVVDRFLIGTIRLQQVGAELSISSDGESLSYPPKPGDYVEIFQTEQTWPDVVVENSTTEADVRFAEATFRATLGKSLPDRVALWDEFLSRYPESDIAQVVEKERDWLRRRMSEESKLKSRASENEEERLAREAERRSVNGYVSVPSKVWAGEPVQVTASFERLDRVQDVRLLARPAGAALYETIVMPVYGDSSFAAPIPEKYVSETGDVDVLVEVIRTDGEVERVEDAVISVVEKPRDPLPVKNRSATRVTAEFVDFKSGPDVDEYLKTEAEFRYRVDHVLDSFAVGVGVFRGELGLGDASPERLSLGYGYAESRVRFLPALDFGVTAMFGNRQGSNQSTFISTLGLQSDIRLGYADSTSLALGVSVVGRLTVESWLDLELREIERVPMRAQVVVTNLPVGSDLGVSLKYGAGYEIIDSLEILAQASWNARTIRHFGFGLGGSLAYSW